SDVYKRQVGGPPNSRGVVCTASYEARKFGIHSAMPCYKAYKLCPHAIFIYPRFSVYKQLSQEIHEVFYEYTDIVESMGLDEAYLDVTQNKKNLSLAYQIAKEIKQKIFQKTKLTCSAGISNGKFLAKIASGMNKPNGLTIIHPKDSIAFLENLPIEKFYGIGKILAEKLKSAGIYNGKTLKEKSLSELKAILGKTAFYYYDLVRGVDHAEVKSSRERKSIGSEETFEKDLKDLEEIRLRLNKIAEDLWKRMEQVTYTSFTLTLKIKYFDFQVITRSKTSKFPFDSLEIIKDTAWNLFMQNFSKKKVRLLGLTLSNFKQTQETEGLLLFSLQ
ncbi:MAG: DNA polymerase IV, partial [Leptospiraceae bacterium]|nr:DNA polymerase IV [Leptospiraceae bacterium]